MVSEVVPTFPVREVNVKATHIVIARHGEYDRMDLGYRLTSKGRRQMERLAAALQVRLPSGNITLLSSTAPRAFESAEILGKTMGVTPVRHDVLWSGTDSPRMMDFKAVMRLIDESETDVLILVTHLEYAGFLPRDIAHLLGADVNNFPNREVEKGEAWLIDCLAKSCERIVPKMS